jgi:putative Ca2+/H+ antiporter (TMEM165/GDT1 family)
LFGAAERCQIIRVCAALTHHHRAGVFWGFFFSLAICWSCSCLFFGGSVGYTLRIVSNVFWLVSFAVGQQLEPNKNGREEQQKVHADSLALKMARYFRRDGLLSYGNSLWCCSSLLGCIFLWETRRDLAGDNYSIISFSLSLCLTPRGI